MNVNGFSMERVAPFRAHREGALLPRPHEAYGLCALGLPQFKAAGLVVVFDHYSPLLLSGEW